MKNYVPLILAVLLGLAAVLAVGRLLKVRKQTAEDTVSVVATARRISKGDEMSVDAVVKKVIPASSRPAQSIGWANAPMVAGQNALRDIASGDYVMLSDIGLTRSMATIVGQGEWAVTINVGSGGIAGIVQPGDEVAIMGTFSVEQKIPSADLAAAPSMVKKDVTLVLFPRVRVLDIGRGRVTMGRTEGHEIIVGLPPREAQVIIAAQRKMELTLALRRPGDESAISRKDAGVVDDQTFTRLLDGLEEVTVSHEPGNVSAVDLKPAQ